MLRVGLTGGIACGKSTVARMLQARGAHTLDADKLVHDLMHPGEPVYDEVVKHFGRGIVNPSDGSIDRAKLAEAAFGSGRVAELNALVHPAVMEAQAKWMEEIAKQEPDAIAVVEAALILEAGVRGRFDKLIVVTCSREQKAERYAKRTASADAGPLAIISARKEAERRISAQMPDEEKIKSADFVIDSSGSVQNTERQVDDLFKKLKNLSTQI